MTKVLIFESDPEFAGELRTELGRLGCTVHIVEDGNVGLTVAVQDRPDLILLSIELPRMNGFSVCNKLKKDGALKDIPLIIMSSESSEETFEQHKKLRTRAEDYVHKPIAFGELLEHIRRYAKIEGGEAEAGDGIVIDEAALVFEDVPDSVEPEPTIMTSDMPGLGEARPAAAPTGAPAGRRPLRCRRRPARCRRRRRRPGRQRVRWSCLRVRRSKSWRSTSSSAARSIGCSARTTRRRW